MTRARRLGTLGALSTLVLTASIAGPAAAGPDRGSDSRSEQAPLVSSADPVSGSYIVVLATGTEGKVAPAPGSRAGTRAQERVRDVTSTAVERAKDRGATVTHVYGSLGGYAARLTPQQLADLRTDPDVLLVEQDSRVTISADQTNPTWGLDRIDQRNRPVDGLYRYDLTGQGVRSYVIDTGIRTSHTEFSGRTAPGYTAINDGRGTDDCNGHGTHVAGTVGGSVYGVAKQTTLVPVRVLNCQGSGTNAGVIAGMDWVTANAVRPAVANMSLGGGASTATDSAVARMTNAGVTVVVAAGNESQDACNVSPARAASAITVGSTTSTDARSSFSNFGTCLDMFAPGSSITSAWYTSNTATNTISGTSMASPHVAGAAALYLQANSSATPAQVTSALTGQATTGLVTSPGSGSPNRLLYTADLDGGSTPTPDPDPAPGDAVTNGGFEQGSTGWSSTQGVVNSTGYPARTGTWKAWLNGYGQSATDTLQQTVTVPSSGRLTFWLRVDSAETTTTRSYDRLQVQLVTSSGTSTLATYSNLNESSGYGQRSFDLSSRAGQQVTVRFVGTEDSTLQTSFLIDDVSVAAP